MKRFLQSVFICLGLLLIAGYSYAQVPAFSSAATVNTTTVRITFTNGPFTAVDISKYTITGGVTISNAVISGPTTVDLTVSAVASNYTCPNCLSIAAAGVTNATGSNANSPTNPIADGISPTAAITYSDADGIVKQGDVITITATFSEAIKDAPPAMQISLSGANTLAATNMIKSSTTVYTYAHTVGSGNGAVSVALSNGTDVNNVAVNPTPTSGGSFTVDNLPPTNQNTIFPASVTRKGGVAVTIVAGSAADVNWFAPAGTITFVANGTTITTAAGNATSIIAPSTEGAYKLFVLDAAGNASTASTATLTVDNTAPINQNTIFPASVTRKGGVAVTIVAGTSTDTNWFAPSGTTIFIANGTTITTAAGNATSIIASSTEGSYQLFVLDVAGNASTASTATLTVDNTAPTNQNTIFPASTTRQGGASVTIVAGLAADFNWFAPAGTTNFVANGTTITTVAGNATSILAPSTEGAYKLFVLDVAGNASAASTATLTVDNTGPTLTFTKPVASTYVNTTQVTYTIGETLSSGTITWTRTGGTADGSSPHAQALTGAELTTNQTNYTLTNNPTLVNGSIYTVAFAGLDAVGNSTTVSNTLVTFDTSPPSAPSTVTVVTTGGTVVSNYWNGTNTGVNLGINIPNDASLVSGTVQIEARISSGTFATIASTSSSTIATVSTTKTMSITNVAIQAITGYTQGVSLEFRARLIDQAGNVPSAFTTSATQLFVDTIKPTILSSAFFANLTAPTGNDALFTTCSGTTRDKSTSREFIHLVMSETMAQANGTLPTIGTPGFAASAGVFDVGCSDRGASAYHPTNVIHLQNEFLSTSPDVDGAWDGNTTYSFTAGGTNVRDVAGNEMANVPLISPADLNPPVLATGLVLFLNGSGPETIVFSFDETLNTAVTNTVTGFTTSIGTINTLLTNYNPATRTVTLTSTLDGMWTDAVTLTYDQATGNVIDPAMNELVAFGGLAPKPAEPIFLQGVSISSNNTTNATYARTGNTITLGFTAARALLATPIVTIGGLSASVSLVSGLTYSATLVTTAAVPDGTIAFQIDVTEATTATTVTTTSDGSSIKFDKFAPTVVLSDNHADNIVRDADVVTITATFTELNNLNAPPSISISQASPAITNASMSSTGNPLVWTYAWDVPAGAVNDGTVNVTISAIDPAGNANTAATGKTSYIIDNTPPTVTIATSSALLGFGTNGTTAASVNFLLTFSETVPTTVLASDISVNTGNDVTNSDAYPGVSFTALIDGNITGSGTTRTVNVTGLSGTGWLKINLNDADNSVTDVAGNPAIDYSSSFTFPGTEAYTRVFPEPSNPITSPATTRVGNTLTVSWSNAVAPAQQATHYLVMIKKTTVGAFPSVNDGTYMSNDFDLTDNILKQNIPFGTTVASFSGLPATDSYDVIIHPYSLSPNNANTNINFGTATQVSGTSDIIQSFNYAGNDNILYKDFQEATNIVVSTTSKVLEEFTLRDGGGATDNDALPTLLTGITLEVTNWQNLRRLALYDGSTELQELAVTSGGTGNITFNAFGSTFQANDGGTKVLTIRGSFQGNGVIDSQVITFRVVSVTANSTSSSQFLTGTPAGIVSTPTLNQNKIEVVATQIDFTTVPASASISVPFTVQVSARDAFANLDLDYNGTITATETNPASDVLFRTINNPSGAFVNGQLTYPANFQFDVGDGNVQLTINSGAGSGANNVNAGAIAGTSPVISVISSYESLIVSSDFYNETSRDINYINYQDANITSASNGFELDFLYLADGGYDLSDADGAPTILDDLTLGISNPQSIKKIAIYEKDLNTNVITEIQELDNSNIIVTNGYGQITFNNLNISSPDDFYKGVLILATFNSSTATIQDRDTIQVSVLAATLNAGSKFAPNAAQTNSIAGEPINNVTFPPAATALQRGTFSPYNKLQVIATSLDFVTQPSIFAGSNEPIDGSAGASPGGSTGIVHARDKFAVIDTDFTGASSATTLSADANPFGYPSSFTNGVLNLTGMQYGNAGDGTLIVKAGVLDSSVSGVGDIGNSIACSTVDVIHVTAQNDISNGVEVSESLKGGTTSKRIFGLDFFAEHSTSSEPSLTGFSIIFRDDVGDPYPYTSASGTVYKNFKLFMAEGNGSPIPLAEGVDYTLDPFETQTAALITSGAPSTSKDKLAFILTNPVTLYQSNYKFYLNVDVDVNVSVGTKPITPYLIDLGYGFINTNNNIKTTVGSSTAQVQGITRKFASVKPPVLVYTSPSNGQLNVDPALNVIKLKFDVPVVTFDGVIKVYNRETGTLRATFTASNGLSDGSNLKTAAVDTLEFVAPIGFDFKQDTVYYVTIEKGVFSNIDVNQRKGISDEGFNLFGGISYNGTFYFKGSSPNPPQLVGTDATKYYFTPTSATFNFQFNQAGKVHYMVVHPTSPGVAPLKVTNAQILGTSPYTNSTIIARGTTVIDQQSPNLQFVTINADLTNNIDYYVYAFAENNAKPNPIVTSAPYGSNTNTFAVDADGPTLKIKKTSTTTNLVNNPRFEVCTNSSVKMEEPIIISEPAGNAGDFAAGFGPTSIQSFNILLPTGFQFDVTKKPAIAFNGDDFKPLPTDNKAPEDTISASFINTTILKISFVNNGSTDFDNIIISNLHIIASSSDINGNIIRFSGSGLTTISDGRVLARITSGSSGAITFNNSYNKAFTPWPYSQITKTVTYIPDNFATTIKLIPEPPLGDYGASFFSGSGLTNDELTLAAVTLDAAFNITLTHTDQNGCNSTTVEQYLVYDHTKTIPELLKTTVAGYNISGTKVGLKPGPINSDNIQGTNDDYVPGLPTTTLDQVDSVSYVGLAGYQLIDLYADIPVRTKGSGQVLNYDSAVWKNLVNNIPRLAVVDKNNNGGLHDFTSTLGQIFKTYNWEYSDLINKSLTGSLYPYDSIDSRFAERVRSTGTANGKLFFNAGSLGIVEFTGVYQSTADFSVFVPFRQEVELFIPAIPVVGVSGESDKLGRTPIFCENGLPFTITGYPLATSSDVTGFFTLKDSISGVSITDPGFVDNGNGTATFSPSSGALKNGYKTIKIEYTYKQNNSPAVGTGVLYIRVTPNPVANFTTSMRCEDIDITFTDTSTLSLAADVSIEQAIWSYADNKALARENGDTILYPSTRIPIHKYSDPGSYPNVSLSVRTNFGCANVAPAIKTLSIGGTPKVAFSFNGVSIADPITFTNESTIVNDVTNKLDWTFGDANSQTITSNFSSPVINNYTTAGSYTANLKVTSLIGCNANLYKSVIILPRVVSTVASPYLATFETNNGGWQHAPTDTTNNMSDSWQHGGVNKPLTKSTIDGTKAWATSLTGTFSANERSALYSPSFDISGLARPMISFDKFAQFNRNEGVIIQYSVDNNNVADETKAWFVLGEDTDEGVEWFNGQGIASKPGDQLTNDFGWYDSNIKEWREAKHTLSNVSPKPPLAGATRVVFRFALAARESNLPITVDNEGFAMDNFRVGERTRIILHESFANTGNSSAQEKSENDIIRGFKTVGTDVVRINYHTAFPGADPFNQNNPADNSSRALFYNVSSTPDSYLDGEYGGIPLLKQKFSAWGEKSFDEQTLSLANAKIKINQTIDGDGIKVDVDVTAIDTTIPKDSVALFIGILEESIPFGSLSGSQQAKVLSQETVFDYVLKKMLPSAAGTVLSADILNGTTKNFGLVGEAFTWKPDPSKFSLPNTGDLAIVAFLQNVVTKKIYQSSIVMDLNDPVVNVVTGIESILPEQVNVYPNPASKEFRVELPAFVQNEVPMNLIDLTGRKHDGGVIRSGSNKATVNIENLAEGIYILEIGSGSTGIIRKKIMVVMKN